MIISHRKKFAFFANPKTGSKAAGIMLRMAGVFDENDILIRQPFVGTRTADLCLPAYNAKDIPDHLTPAEAIERGLITLEQMREYNCFAFLREPEERYNASRIAMVMNRHGQISNGRPLEKPHLPQYMYFVVDDEEVITALDFDDYKAGIKHMYDILDAKYTHMDLVDIGYKRNWPNDRYKYNPLDHQPDIQLYKRMIQRTGGASSTLR